MHRCMEHVNHIPWGSEIPEILAARILQSSHDAGTVGDATVVRLLRQRSYPHFITCITVLSLKCYYVLFENFAHKFKVGKKVI